MAANDKTLYEKVAEALAAEDDRIIEKLPSREFYPRPASAITDRALVLMEEKLKQQERSNAALRGFNNRLSAQLQETLDLARKQAAELEELRYLATLAARDLEYHWRGTFPLPEWHLASQLRAAVEGEN